MIFTAPDSTQRLFDCTTICQLYDPPAGETPRQHPYGDGGIDMTAQEFQDRLVSLLHQRPFVPFEVELLCGDKFVVDRQDSVSWGGGAAAFGALDEEIYLFDYTRTRGFKALSETASA